MLLVTRGTFYINPVVKCQINDGKPPEVSTPEEEEGKGVYYVLF